MSQVRARTGGKAAMRAEPCQAKSLYDLLGCSSEAGHNVNFTIETDNGKTVRLASALLMKVTDMPGGEPQRAELCAVVNVENDLPASQTGGVRALPTKLGFVADNDHAFAVLHVLYGSTLLVTALDLAEPETQALMAKAPRQGFAVAIVGEAVQKLVRVPVTHLQPEIAKRGLAARRASFESKADFLAFILRRIGEAEGRRTLGLQGLTFDRVVLSFASAPADGVVGDLWSAVAGTSKSLH